MHYARVNFELYNLIHPDKCTTGYGSVWNYLVNCDADPDNPSILLSSMSTSIKFTVNGAASENTPLGANDTLTVEDINSNEISFQCMGTSKSSRFYLNYLKITYSID